MVTQTAAWFSPCVNAQARNFKGSFSFSAKGLKSRRERNEGRWGIDITKRENGRSYDETFSAALASFLICSVDDQHTNTYTQASHPRLWALYFQQFFSRDLLNPEWGKTLLERDAITAQTVIIIRKESGGATRLSEHVGEGSEPTLIGPSPGTKRTFWRLNASSFICCWQLISPKMKQEEQNKKCK